MLQANFTSRASQWQPIWVVLLSCVLMGFSGVTQANGATDYSQGMAAYIKGDYPLAQTLWLSAAKSKHSRAMFNLGLLHQQKKLSNAENAKAERWFNLAGEGGYAAADFHHSNWLLERGGESRKALALLQRAANNGYLPARNKVAALQKSGKLGSIVATSSNTSADAASHTASHAANSANKTLEPTYLTEQWLEKRKSSAWTIQILAFDQLMKVEEFIDLHRLHDRAAYFSERTGDVLLYKLVYGEFANKQAAEAARGKLTPALQEHGPWLRTLASVQAVIKEQ